MRYLIIRRMVTGALCLIGLGALSSARGQNLTGRWEGYITQEGKADRYLYEIEIEQDNGTVSGMSFSASTDGKASARFLLSGAWDGRQLVLQEVEQTEPAEPRWCLKYATLTFGQDGPAERLTGEWRADGCTPGRMVLERGRAQPEAKTVELPFTMTGTWTGHLSQSDRDYGFFFELNLDEQPLGHSSIDSEGNGGTARHALKWSFEEKSRTLSFEESAVVEKTDPRWPWCIKSATLKMRREGSRYILEGPWGGYIEGKSLLDPRSRCASGTIYLEKPVLTSQVEQETRRQEKIYEAGNSRKVKVERVVEVQSRELRLRVWDNGTVDGDMCTIFLNGQRILHNFRVSKHRYAIPVTLQEETNFLVLHAEDLGDITPNTIAVSVDDGFKEQIIIMSSNLKESGAIMIREFKVE